MKDNRDNINDNINELSSKRVKASDNAYMRVTE